MAGSDILINENQLDESTRPFVLWIEELQRQRGWNQAELADAIGVSASLVSRWKVGQRPDVKSLWQIADQLGADEDELLLMAGVRRRRTNQDSPRHAQLIAKLRQAPLNQDRFQILDSLLDSLRTRPIGEGGIAATPTITGPERATDV